MVKVGSYGPVAGSRYPLRAHPAKVDPWSSQVGKFFQKISCCPYDSLSNKILFSSLHSIQRDIQLSQFSNIRENHRFSIVFGRFNPSKSRFRGSFFKNPDLPIPHTDMLEARYTKITIENEFSDPENPLYHVFIQFYEKEKISKNFDFWSYMAMDPHLWPIRDPAHHGRPWVVPGRKNFFKNQLLPF